jgi:flagellar motor switch/type III secretory pathway protein FliN
MKPQLGIPSLALLRASEASSSSAPFEAALRFNLAEAEARRRLIALFDGVEFIDGHRTLTAAASLEMDGGRGPAVWMWFETAFGPVGAAVLRLDHAPTAWPIASSETLATTVLLTMLGRMEFAIATLEAFIPDWRPTRFGAARGLHLRLDLEAEDGQLAHRLALCVPEETCAALPAASPVNLSRILSSLPLQASVLVAGPLLSARDLGSVAVGDLVWIGEDQGGSIHAQLQLSSGVLAQGAFHPSGRLIRLETSLFEPVPHSRSGEASMPLEVLVGEEGGRPAPGFVQLEDLPVAVSFELGPWPIRLADLAGLAPGFILPLPASGEDVRVRLVVGNRPLARGRLVAMGRRHGVLIDTVGG